MGLSSPYTLRNLYEKLEFKALQISKAIIDHDYGLQSNLPDEMEYADARDFLNENAEADRVITLEISRLLKKENLVVNDDKTEKHFLKERQIRTKKAGEWSRN